MGAEVWPIFPEVAIGWPRRVAGVHEHAVGLDMELPAEAAGLANAHRVAPPFGKGVLVGIVGLVAS